MLIKSNIFYDAIKEQWKRIGRYRKASVVKCNGLIINESQATVSISFT